MGFKKVVAISKKWSIFPHPLQKRTAHQLLSPAAPTCKKDRSNDRFPSGPASFEFIKDTRILSRSRNYDMIGAKGSDVRGCD